MEHEDFICNGLNLVEVVIPIYRNTFSDLEMRSLRQVSEVLKNYRISLVKPESLDVTELVSRFPSFSIRSFRDEFFEGIAGYNSLMMSEEFYSAFQDSQYILIYQTDAYVFRDELEQWCREGYDYVGAPWLKKPVYNLPVISWIMSIGFNRDRRKGRRNKQELYNKVGNGGLSLRKVQSHLRVVKEERESIREYLAVRNHMYNEDVFWSGIESFRYPDALRALAFSFDKYPKLCYRLNGRKLPFGCHAWYSRKMRGFWRGIIEF